MHKIDNPYRVSVFSLKNHHPFSMVFAWLWGYEFAVLPMFSIHVQHTRLKKKTYFFVSARGGQVSQLLQRVCVAPVCAINKRKHVVSDGSIHISSELMLVAQLLGYIFFKGLPLPIYTLRARCLPGFGTISVTWTLTSHPTPTHVC